MDTSTHIIMGIGLASLAQIDPVISENPVLTQAVLLGTVIGSNAPDFDILYKLKGQSSYIKNHRSYSHSLPILPIWAILISLTIIAFFPSISFFHVFWWTFISVIVHVLTDLLNVHGTQILLPFNKSWISFDTIPLFDTFIMILHLGGFFCTIFFNTGIVFLIVYLIICIYILFRFCYQQWIKQQLKNHFQQATRIKLIPKTSPLHWGILIETKEDFLFGSYFLNAFTVEHVSSKILEYPDLIKKSTKHPLVHDFLSSTNFAFPFVEKRKKGYFIIWKDLRFRQKKFFPYSSILYVSADGKEIYSAYSGWLYSLKQLRKVIKHLKRTDINKKWSEINY
ncbi:metal-dependent hydrolase [Niallia sp. Krafla_26]|uniref:metal-dependent hydrolase n=1 Tax=Niallia sp. Krafla_26 TaxID=3064703 RepID=UPI003D17ACBE